MKLTENINYKETRPKLNKCNNN